MARVSTGFRYIAPIQRTLTLQFLSDSSSIDAYFLSVLIWWYTTIILTVFNTMCWQWILFETHCRQAYSYYSVVCGLVRYEPVVGGGARDRSRARHQSLVSARFAHVRLVRQLRSRAHASRRRHRCHSLSLWSVYIRPLNNVLLPSNSLHNRWRRSLVKLVGRGPGQSGQAIKLFQTPRQIGSTFHFWQKSFILHVAELFNNSFEWKNVTL